MSTRKMRKDALTVRAPDTAHNQLAKIELDTGRKQHSKETATLQKCPIGSQARQPSMKSALERALSRRGSSVWSSSQAKTTRKTKIKMAEMFSEIAHALGVSG